MSFKNILKKVLAKGGYILHKKNIFAIQDENYLTALKQYLQPGSIIFDIGANRGQTTEKYLHAFGQQMTIHAFEPSKVCFNILFEKLKNNTNVIPVNQGMGENIGTIKFNEYDWSELNSFNTRKTGNAKIAATYDVYVNTVDAYCQEKNIEAIDLLKTDTEGFELSVLKGAHRMLSENRIRFIHIECFFRNDYEEELSFGDIYNFLIQHHYYLVRFYAFEYTTQGHAYRADAMFAKLNYSESKNT